MATFISFESKDGLKYTINPEHIISVQEVPFNGRAHIKLIDGNAIQSDCSYTAFIKKLEEVKND
jgi:uncharacterized protein YlzI (FlbEa/FlbD family)